MIIYSKNRTPTGICLVLPHLSETYGGLLFFFGGGWHFSLAGVGVRRQGGEREPVQILFH